MGTIIGVVLAFLVVFAPSVMILRSRAPSLKQRVIWALFTIAPILILVVAVGAVAKYSESAILQNFLFYNGIAILIAYVSAWVIFGVFRKNHPRNSSDEIAK